MRQAARKAGPARVYRRNARGQIVPPQDLRENLEDVSDDDLFQDFLEDLSRVSGPRVEPTLFIDIYDPNTKKTVMFKIKKTTEFVKMFKSYYERIDTRGMFIYKNEVSKREIFLKETDTAEKLGFRKKTTIKYYPNDKAADLINTEFTKKSQKEISKKEMPVRDTSKTAHDFLQFDRKEFLEKYCIHHPCQNTKNADFLLVLPRFFTLAELYQSTGFWTGT